MIGTTSYLEWGEKGKKPLPEIKTLPEPVKRSSGVNPNFLCDNASYLLGVDQKGKPERAKKCFEAAKALHQKILAGVDSPAAKAVLAYFEHWNPDTALSHPEIVKNPDLTAGGNLIFLFGDDLFSPENNEVQKDPAICQAWEKYSNDSGDSSGAFCPVLERNAPIARLHPSIKGVRGAQSSGASLISYNADAFCSYGKEQGEKRRHQSAGRLCLYHRLKLSFVGAPRPSLEYRHARKSGSTKKPVSVRLPVGRHHGSVLGGRRQSSLPRIVPGSHG